MFFVLAILIAFVALTLWAAGGIQEPRTFEEAPLVILDARPARASVEAPETITVVTWNIAWGYGWGSEGSGRAKPKEHFERALARIAETVRALQPDVLLLQETDFDATRSRHLDQARAIAEGAGLPYLARAESWSARWVPFPYWPPSEHFGRVSSGGAIASRFPIRSNKVELLEKPAKNSRLYNLFYLFRYLQRVELELAPGLEPLVVFNTHLEAFDAENRALQAARIKDVLEAEATPSTIFGGDCNTVPPESTVRANYPDEPHTNHEHDVTLELLRGVPGLEDTVPEDSFRAHEKEFFTFPAHAPNRKLDYLLTGEAFEVIEARVVREAGEVSDHLPLLVKLRRLAYPQRP